MPGPSHGPILLTVLPAAPGCGRAGAREGRGCPCDYPALMSHPVGRSTCCEAASHLAYRGACPGTEFHSEGEEYSLSVSVGVAGPWAPDTQPANRRKLKSVLTILPRPPRMALQSQRKPRVAGAWSQCDYGFPRQLVSAVLSAGKGSKERL